MSETKLPYRLRSFSYDESLNRKRSKNKRRLSYDINDFKREMYRQSINDNTSTAKTTTTTITATTATTIITLPNSVGFSSQLSPNKNIVNDGGPSETGGREITEEFLFKDIDVEDEDE